MILGIILIVAGLVIFMVGGALTNDNPGIEKSHAVMMALGFVAVISGLVSLTLSVFN